MPVLFSGALVGKISGLTANTAQVQLLSDPDFRVLVSDQQTGTPGIVKGQIGGNIQMERIPQTESINVGETIVTSGQDGEFPSGLIIGRISKIEQDANSIFKTARIEQPFNQLELRVLMVVTGVQ